MRPGSHIAVKRPHALQIGLMSLYNGGLRMCALAYLNRRRNCTITRGCRFIYGDNSMATTKSGSSKAKGKKKTATRKAATKKAVKKTAAAKKAVKKAAARKPATKKTAASKAGARKASAKKAATKKAAAKKPAAKKAPAKKAGARKTVTKKPAARKPAASRGKGKAAVLSKPAETSITREGGRYALPSTIVVDLPKNYRPKAREEYMGPKQLAYFRAKLRDWRDQLVEESRQTMDNLRDEVRDVGDEAERATRETENSLELRTRDRYRKLIAKIDKALRRIEDGSYGYCEETDEEIGIDRLDARPIATLSLDAQERREHLRKQMGD